MYKHGTGVHLLAVVLATIVTMGVCYGLAWAIISVGHHVGLPYVWPVDRGPWAVLVGSVLWIGLICLLIKLDA